MPIIFICNRRSIKQITQKCSEGKIELFFFDAPRGPALKKRGRAADKGRGAARGAGDGANTTGGFGVRAAENSSPRASIWSSLSPPGFSPARVLFFTRRSFFRDERVNAFRLAVISGRARYLCNDICKYNLLLNVAFIKMDVIFCG